MRSLDASLNARFQRLLMQSSIKERSADAEHYARVLFHLAKFSISIVCENDAEVKPREEGSP